MDTKFIIIESEELGKLIQDAIRNSLPPPQPQPIISEERLLTSDELAEKLHLSKVSLWKLRKTGRIKGHKLGRRVYYRLSEII